MGISSKKQTTSSKSTSTPTNPQWVTDALQGYTQRVSDLGKKPATDYVAPASQLQNKAFGLANDLGGWESYYDQAKGLLGRDYNNEYTNDVVNTSLAGFDDQAARLRASNAATAAKNNAFGGSRYAVQQAMTDADLSRERAGLEAGLRSDAYDKAAQYGLSQAGLLGQLGSSLGSGQRADLESLLGAGQVQRDIDADMRTADVSLAQILGQLYGQGQYGLFQGNKSTGKSTTTSTPSLMETIGQGAQTAASLAALFSDIRLKRDIEPLGEHQGRKWYRYRYLWSDKPHVGVMAQENPDLSFEGPGGFLMVDYGKI